jgi:hypothetical protein
MAVINGLRDSGGVFRFEVAIDGKRVGAYLSLATCQADRERGAAVLSVADFYRWHQPRIDEIVSAKISAGARHPVVVMARDLQRHPPGLVQQVHGAGPAWAGPALDPGGGPHIPRQMDEELPEGGRSAVLLHHGGWGRPQTDRA